MGAKKKCRTQIPEIELDNGSSSLLEGTAN